LKLKLNRCRTYHEKGLSLYVGEAEVEVAGDALLLVAVENHVLQTLVDAPLNIG
jgi:hypothetical protein